MILGGKIELRALKQSYHYITVGVIAVWPLIPRGEKIAEIHMHLQEQVSHQLWHLSYFNQLLS